MVKLLVLALALIGFGAGVVGASLMAASPSYAQACRPPQCS